MISSSFSMFLHLGLWSLKTILQACDSYAPAFFQLGVCYSEVRQVLKNQDKRNSQLSLSLSLAQVSDCIKAKEMYRKAVQLHPGCPERFSNLLWPPRRRSAMRYVEALNNLGVACRHRNHSAEILAIYSKDPFCFVPFSAGSLESGSMQ